MNTTTSAPTAALTSEGFVVEYYDVVDRNDKLLGYTADFDEARRRGLWRRGIRVIIYTDTGRIVMQKRSNNLVFYPGEVEVSVGGGVNTGETPLDAVIREVKEELGIDISGYKIRFLGRTRYNHRFKNNCAHRIIGYNYAVRIPEKDLKFNPDTRETEAVFLMTRRQLLRALRTHRIKNFGRLVPLYATWRKLLDEIPKN